MSERMWWVCGSMTGLRCEEHQWEPDNALAGPFKTGTIAAIAMRRMIERDRWEMIAGGVLAVGISAVFASWLVWTVAGWVL